MPIVFVGSTRVAARLCASCLLLLTLTTACAGLRSAGTDAVQPSRPSVSIPVAAQARSLTEARGLLEKDRCDAAARLINRASTTASSALLAETRYLLARCYERQGRLSAALAEYELIATAPDLQSEEVRASIARLRQCPDVASRAGTTGLLIHPRSLPSKEQLDAWMRQVASAGVTTVIVEAASTHESRGSAGAQGVYFETTRAPVLRDVMSELIPVAHQHHIRVFGRLCLDRMDWIEPSVGWHDAHYDVVRREIGPSTQVDLFNPAVRDYLSQLVADLAQSGMDGLLLWFAGQPTDGFSRHAAEAFAYEFQTPLEPASILAQRPPNTSDIVAAPRQNGTIGLPPDYWRWVGWKMRERITVLERLAAEARRHAPLLQIALELHPESVMEPVKALVQYGEDLIEAKRTSVQFLAIRATATRDRSDPRAVPTDDATARMLARAGELVGGLDRLWIICLGIEPLPRPPHLDRGAIPPEVGLILDAPLS